MQKYKELVMKRHKKLQNKGCKAFCCSYSCRFSIFSSEKPECNQSISSIAHAMVQEKLDQIIKHRQESRNEETTMIIRHGKGRKRRQRLEETKFVVMVAMEKSSNDPREDFKESIKEMIITNKIHEVKDLRRLMNYYVAMNSEELRGVILEVFHEVCTDFFLYSEM